MQVYAARRWDTLKVHPLFGGVGDKDGYIVALLKNSGDANSLANVVLRPIVQPINPDENCPLAVLRLTSTALRHR